MLLQGSAAQPQQPQQPSTSLPVAPPKLLAWSDAVPSSSPPALRHMASMRMSQLLQNIATPPVPAEAARYRTIKKSNKILAQELFTFELVGQYLSQLGFVYDAGNVVFTLPEGSSIGPIRTALIEIGQLLESTRVEAEQASTMSRAYEENLRRQRISDSVRMEKARVALSQDQSLIFTLREELGKNDAQYLPRILGDLAAILENPPASLNLRDSATRDKLWDPYGSPEVLRALGYVFAHEEQPSNLQDLSDTLVLVRADLRGKLVQVFPDIAKDLIAECEEIRQREQADAIRAAKELKEREKWEMYGGPQKHARSTNATTTTNPPGSGVRIPIAEAMKVLLGNASPSEVMSSLATGGGEADTQRQREAEEDLSATSVIGEIVSLIDMTSEIRGDAGLTSKGRKERHKLLDAWKERRDMSELYAERDKRQAELKEAQRMTGKSISSFAKENK